MSLLAFFLWAIGPGVCLYVVVLFVVVVGFRFVCMHAGLLVRLFHVLCASFV